MTEREAKAFLNNLKVCIEEHPIVADWLVEVADRKTEPTISKMEQVDKDINVRSKDEPYIDIETGILHWCGWKYKRIFEDEPQTDCAWR